MSIMVDAPKTEMDQFVDDNDLIMDDGLDELNDQDVEMNNSDGGNEQQDEEMHEEGEAELDQDMYSAELADEGPQDTELLDVEEPQVEEPPVEEPPVEEEEVPSTETQLVEEPVPEPEQPVEQEQEQEQEQEEEQTEEPPAVEEQSEAVVAPEPDQEAEVEAEAEAEAETEHKESDEDEGQPAEDKAALFKKIPILLHCQNDDTNVYYLFPTDSLSSDANQDMTLFKDHTSVDLTVEEVFGYLRSIFESRGQEFGMENELTFDFPQLGLHLGEDNCYSRELSMHDILLIFSDLCENTNKDARPDTFELVLDSRQRFISIVNYLSDLVKEGAGLEKVSEALEPEPESEIGIVDAEGVEVVELTDTPEQVDETEPVEIVEVESVDGFEDEDEEQAQPVGQVESVGDDDDEVSKLADTEQPVEEETAEPEPAPEANKADDEDDDDLIVIEDFDADEKAAVKEATPEVSSSAADELDVSPVKPAQPQPQTETETETETPLLQSTVATPVEQVLGDSEATESKESKESGDTTPKKRALDDEKDDEFELLDSDQPDAKKPKSVDVDVDVNVESNST